MLLADRDPYNCHLDIIYVVYRTGKDVAMRSIIRRTLDPGKGRQGRTQVDAVCFGLLCGVL